MRFFIALEIPENSKQELEDVQFKIAQIIPDLRLTNPEKFHLTIAFIGEQPEYLKEALTTLITEAVSNVSSFTVSPGIIDGFPDIHRPNVLWVGVNGQIDNLLVIRERIKDGLENLGLTTDERRFIPHITLGKTNSKIKLSKQQEYQLQEIALKHYLPIKIDSLKLFESIPQGGLHAHNTLAEVKLSS